MILGIFFFFQAEEGIRVRNVTGVQTCALPIFEAWLRLGEAMGVHRKDLVGQRLLLPGVRFAVDAYVNFCRSKPWLEAVAASLTAMFAPLIVKERLAAMLSHYKWVAPAGLQYFKNRLTQAPRDAEYALG